MTPKEDLTNNGITFFTEPQQMTKITDLSATFNPLNRHWWPESSYLHAYVYLIGPMWIRRVLEIGNVTEKIIGYH